jgi:hypothetical protein
MDNGRWTMERGELGNEGNQVTQGRRAMDLKPDPRLSTIVY